MNSHSSTTGLRERGYVRHGAINPKTQVIVCSVVNGLIALFMVAIIAWICRVSVRRKRNKTAMTQASIFEVDEAGTRAKLQQHETRE